MLLGEKTMFKKNKKSCVGSGIIFFFIFSFSAVASFAVGQEKLLFNDLHTMIPFHDGNTLTMAFGDVDSDGDVDLLVGIYNYQSRLFLNNGAGLFTDATSQIPFPESDAANIIALGDVDGDKDLDVFVGKNRRQNCLYLNDGTGVFTDATDQLPIDKDDRTSDVALGDVDNDGDLDAFIVNGDLLQGSLNRLYLNDGTGVFSDHSSQIPSHKQKTCAVALGDVDEDGDLDAFIGNVKDGQNRLYLNDGNGFFSDATIQIPIVDTSTNDLEFADLDGDFDLDVMIGNFGQNHLYLNDGSGFFVDATHQLPFDDFLTDEVVLGDVDADGDLDALFGAMDQYALYLNDGAGMFSEATSQISSADGCSGAVAFGDVDNDNDLDAVIGIDNQDRLFLNNGMGVFTDTSRRIPTGQDETSAVVLGDVDGDGDLDAVIGNEHADYWFESPNRLYLNDGLGGFSYVPDQMPSDDYYTYALALGDVENDGDLDLFVGNGGENNLCLNDGTGVFFDATNQIPSDSDSTQAVAFDDVDGDGDLDVFVGNRSSLNCLYLNDGTGVFSDATNQIPADDDSTQAVVFGDVDSDGDLDVFIGKRPYLNSLYLNDGNGVFSDATNQIPADSDYTEAVAFGDVDGDNDLDIFIGNDSGSEPNRLYLNDGTGVFSDATSQIPQDCTRTQDVSLGDMDNDGDLDAFLSCEYRQNRLYLNDGSGVYIDATDKLPTIDGATFCAALGDVDLDGDLDALLGRYYQNRLYFNLSHQLAWRGEPRVGKPLVMDLYGPASGWYILAASLHGAYFPIPPLGTLRIQSSEVIYRKSDCLDSEGRASLEFQVPPAPILVGRNLYWQAFVWNPGHFTNLDVTTLTDL